ncbi:MAG TPA: amino acid transporter [Dehalococcoidia bacterium]|nr:amino acid transporter [Dehalococcoidia bacterium]
MPDSLGPWQPLSVGEVAVLFAGLSVPWWISGGWALDLFLGRQTREHGDTDVLVLRQDQLVVRAALAGWDLYAADPPGSLRPWRRGEWLDEPIHDLWCRRGPEAPWAVQLMLANAEAGRWSFRREPSIGGPLAQLTCRTADGIPFLAPAVQLLYKATDAPRPRDEADFTTVLPRLDAERRAWLAAALRRYKPEHPWLARLESA